MDSKIKIILVEDKPLMRMSLASLLKDYAQFDVTGEAGNGRELLDLLKNTEADVVLLDIEMPVMTGIEALKIISLRFPSVKVIVLSQHTDIWYIKNAMAHGAKGYLTKNCLPEQLVKAISTIHEKGFYMEEALMKDLAQESLYGTERPLSKQQLSAREKEVLSALCEGKSEKEIAQRLNISPHTVHFHRMNLHAKTKSHNLADLMKYAHGNGF